MMSRVSHIPGQTRQGYCLGPWWRCLCDRTCSQKNYCRVKRISDAGTENPHDDITLPDHQWQILKSTMFNIKQVRSLAEHDDVVRYSNANFSPDLPPIVDDHSQNLIETLTWNEGSRVQFSICKTASRKSVIVPGCGIYIRVYRDASPLQFLHLHN